ncbi:MAG: hypothetical protein JEZ00_05615 [Anaerolineaceae bacterium]|nr:hypothetical protein [Anaerolineaceae bacterium]
MMKREKKRLIFLPLIIIFTMSCTCGAPGLKNFLPENTENEVSTVDIQPAEKIEEPVPMENEAPEPAIKNGTTGGDIEVYNVNHYDSDGWVTFVGHVRNNMDVVVSSVDISMILFDGDGKIIATESIYPQLSLLPPGKDVPFYFSSENLNNFASYEIVVDEWYESDEEIPSGLEIVYDTAILDEYNMTIIGEIENTSDQPMEWVHVASSLYDQNDILIDVVSTYSMLDIIPAGGKSPFKMYMSQNWGSDTEYALIVQSSIAAEDAPMITVGGVEVTQDDYSVIFTGTVKNETDIEHTYVNIVASLYDENGKLVAAEWGFIEEDSLPANGTGTFELTIWDCPEYAVIEYQAQ